MSGAPPSRRGALLALALMVAIWAYSWIVMKQVMRWAGPFDFAALRFGLGALVLFAVLVLRGHSLRPPPLGLTLAVGLCQTAAFQGLSQWALVSGGAGRVSMLAYTMPFWSVLFAWWLLRERPGRRQWAGIALAVVGLVFIIEPWHALGSGQSTLLALASGGLWGLGTVLTKRMFQLHRPPALSFTAWQMLLGSLMLALVAWLVPQRAIEWTTGMVLGLLYAAVFASSLAWVLWFLIIDRLPATVAGLSSLCVPITAILMAWGLLGERPDAAEGLGIVLIVLGLVTVSGMGLRRKV
ncbi:DMT family transporter [Comamonas flocculans]|uniref:EamA family transporter n=1 Tax=Comamonas flocculans TaxID=2597701 RepID=A0A5B8RZQ4_9BURK|nr:DMT family transporter [Comamonas flocculans]QEA13427.1 EamA family transporter [Comamonas flocculans]